MEVNEPEDPLLFCYLLVFSIHAVCCIVFVYSYLQKLLILPKFYAELIKDLLCFREIYAAKTVSKAFWRRI